MSFAVIIELATLTSYAIIIWGGKQRRDKGWKVVGTLLLFAALTQCVSMALVVSEPSPFCPVCPESTTPRI
jgi:formate hydrogenlyase subunit 3/multisubunit Na+/H+ antiporter MnhD subunit